MRYAKLAIFATLLLAYSCNETPAPPATNPSGGWAAYFDSTYDRDNPH